MRSALTSIPCACTTTVLYNTAFDLRTSLKNASFSEASPPATGAGAVAAGVGRGDATDGAAEAVGGLGAIGALAADRGGGAAGETGRDGASGRGGAPPVPADAINSSIGISLRR